MNGSLKRSNTQDIRLAKHQKSSVKDLKALNEAADLRRQNIQLKQDLEKIKRKYETREGYIVKYRDLKVDYKQVLESFEKSECIRREQKDIIAEQKKYITKVKKKLLSYKDKIARFDTESIQSHNERPYKQVKPSKLKKPSDLIGDKKQPSTKRLIEGSVKKKTKLKP